MSSPRTSGFVLPLPGWVLYPYTALFIAAIHVYLGVGHLTELFRGPPQWTDIWKGFGAMFGAYVFAALATRGFAPPHESTVPGTSRGNERQGRNLT
jgi:hypothetical protein